MSSDHPRTITFTEVTFDMEEEAEEEAEEFGRVAEVDVVVEEDEEEEGEDLEIAKHAQHFEEQQFRRFEPPRSLMLESTVADVSKESAKVKQANDIGVFDFDINFDLDELEDIVDYSVYENRTGLAEDMKFLASMPELCDITFLVGE